MKTPDLDPIPVSNPILHNQSNALRIGHPDDPDHPKVVPREVRTGDTTHTEWELLRAEDREVRGAVSGHAQRDMGFTDFGPEGRSLSNAETHGLIRYFERPVTGDPNDTWEALTGNQTGRVDIEEYMRWLCGNGYFKEGAAQCPAAEATP